VSKDGIRIAGLHYRALIVEGTTRIPLEARPALETLCRAGRVIAWGEREDPLGSAVAASTPEALQTSTPEALQTSTPEALLASIDALCPVDLSIDPPSKDLRYRHVVLGEDHLYILCNEGMESVSAEVHVAAQGARSWVDPWRQKETSIKGTPSLTLAPYTTMVLRITP
jgi:hypothetical protein